MTDTILLSLSEFYHCYIALSNKDDIESQNSLMNIKKFHYTGQFLFTYFIFIYLNSSVKE